VADQPAAEPRTVTATSRMRDGVLSIDLHLDKGLGGHAIITLDDLNGRGLVTIVSDHGTWSYNWRAGGRGSRTLPGFVAGCGQDYLTSKFAPGDDNDVEGTRKALVKVLLEARHARTPWTYPIWGSAQRGHLDSEAKERVREEYDRLYASTSVDEMLSDTIIDHAWEYIHTVPNRAFTRFYELYWQHARAEMLKEHKPVENDEVVSLRAQLAETTAQLVEARTELDAWAGTPGALPAPWAWSGSYWFRSARDVSLHAHPRGYCVVFPGHMPRREPVKGKAYGWLNSAAAAEAKAAELGFDLTLPVEYRDLTVPR